MSTQIDSVHVHASALCKIVDFVNFSNKLQTNNNPQFKLSHSQSLELVARLCGFNTYKGMIDSNDQYGPNERNIDQSKQIIEHALKKHLSSFAYPQLIDMLFTYCKAQEFKLRHIENDELAFGFCYIPWSKWNHASLIYLKANDLSVTSSISRLTDLFTANMLGFTVVMDEDRTYDLMYDPKPILINIPSDLNQVVFHAYQSLSGSIIFKISTACIIYTRQIEFILDQVNGELDQLLSDSTFNFVMPTNPKIEQYLKLKEKALEQLNRQMKNSMIVFPQPLNIPQFEFTGIEYKKMLDLLPTLNKFRFSDSDAFTLSICPSDISLNAWSYHLIDFYNAYMDLARLFFDEIVTSEKANFCNFYINEIGLLCYQTEKQITFKFLHKEFTMSPNDFSIAFSMLLSFRIISEKNKIFNLYMHLYYGFIALVGIKTDLVFDDKHAVSDLFNLMR